MKKEEREEQLLIFNDHPGRAQSHVRKRRADMLSEIPIPAALVWGL
jgi:hypothetical protein